MIPRLSQVETTEKNYLAYLDVLRAAGFAGDIQHDYANRIGLATDNSIYQLLPQAVLYPKDTQDLVTLTRLLSRPEFAQIVISPRGGGTGTNGQSLTSGIVVDLSKHMNRILEINPEEGWVRVQAGVVKDQLNAALKPHGLFFAPELSTSNRATIGGMINTDASGQGSCLYGKTRDHVLALSSVLLDGSVWESFALTEPELETIKARDDKVGDVHRLVDSIANECAEQIDACFPSLNRCLTGYDLAHIRDEQGRFHLNSVLCGGEGSLALIAEAQLNVLPLPKYAALVNVKYDSFDASLRDAKALMDWGPTSIETIDSKVLNLAMEDIVWDTVREFFPEQAGDPDIRGINLVEYTADDEAELQRKVTQLVQHLDQVAGQAGKSFGYSLVYGSDQIKKIWAMRKKAVGLLGNAKGEERPIPFVEDTAVPPENLADFIQEFRAVLDSYGLNYGMFGHVDAGVLHVRPAIDMKDPKQESMIRAITDQVVALTQKYKGLLWGEHGKGIRSEYAPEFFGSLYPELQRIKGAFDPHNQLNPGKIATPLKADAQLLKIDNVPTRGQLDRQISLANRQLYHAAMYCNGNGACYNYDPYDAMCPSWKGTRQRIHSPKGRASLVREWLRLMSVQGVDLENASLEVKKSNFIISLPYKVKNTLKKKQGEYDYSHEVHEAMAGCLACKSCVGQCPIKVNVPDFRARFLEVYHGRYLRPLKDYLVGGLEYMMPALSRFPAPYNFAIENRWIKRVLKSITGMVDSPTLSTYTLLRGLTERGVPLASASALQELSDQQRSRAVVIVQDAFTSYFESQLVLDVVDLLGELGFYVLLAPFKPNGKPLHVHGFMAAFERAARRNTDQLKALADCGIPLVGVDPSMTLTYRQEYATVLQDVPEVSLLQEWLAGALGSVRQVDFAHLPEREYHLLAHCTEKTSAAPSIRQWQQVFALLGQQLHTLASGCCGMSGTYGHEAENLAVSEKIYRLSWGNLINQPDYKGRLLATGYSCRSQVKRFDQQVLQHPAQALLGVIRANRSA